MGNGSRARVKKLEMKQRRLLSSEQKLTVAEGAAMAGQEQEQGQSRSRDGGQR